MFWYYRKKLSHFGQNIWKYRLMNTVTASFNTTVRQMTEMPQQKMTEMFQRNKNPYSNMFVAVVGRHISLTLLIAKRISHGACFSALVLTEPAYALTFQSVSWQRFPGNWPCVLCFFTERRKRAFYAVQAQGEFAVCCAMSVWICRVLCDECMKGRVRQLRCVVMLGLFRTMSL